MTDLVRIPKLNSYVYKHNTMLYYHSILDQHRLQPDPCLACIQTIAKEMEPESQSTANFLVNNGILNHDYFKHIKLMSTTTTTTSKRIVIYNYTLKLIKLIV